MTKNKKILWIALPFLALSLASCADTDELYKGDQYVGGGDSFLSNRYHEWNSNYTNVSSANTTVHTMDGAQVFSGYNDLYGHTANPGGNSYQVLGSSTYHPEAIKEGDTTLTYLTQAGTDKADWGAPGTWVDNSSLYGSVYVQSKKMNRLDDGFSHGIVSRLYDGQVQCDHWNSYAYLQLDKHGASFTFPKELTKAEYFGMVVRGGSNTYLIKDASDEARKSKLAIEVSFYKHPYTTGNYLRDSFLFPAMDLITNSSFDENFIGFYFSDFNYNPSGVVGMSITYTTLDDSGAKSMVDGQYTSVTTSDDMETSSEYYLCMLLYELYLPDSTWSA
jgi:hypothetical protein